MGYDVNCYENLILSSDFFKNLEFFKEVFKNDAVFRCRTVTCGGKNAAILFMDGMTSSADINEGILKPLLSFKKIKSPVTEFLYKNVIFCGETVKENKITELLRGILYGDTVLITEDENALIINTKGFKMRSVEEPKDERVLSGPREGFTESALTNTALLKRKLVTADLNFELMHIGRRTDTKIFICYLNSLVNKKILKNVKKRLKGIDIDGILDSNYITELISDNPYSMLKTVGTTERPDIVAARLLEGRIAIIVDGTPVALTLPYLFCENFQSDDDYYLNYFLGSFTRVLRYICFFLAITVPALFISLLNYYPALLPTAFVISASAARAGIPFPTFSEALVLIFVFEILKESGIRMPQSLGHALSIVGGLVVGQAAVDARLVSAPILIGVALSGICGLMIPRLKGFIFYSKLGLTLLSSALGLYGFFLGMTLITAFILNLNSYSADFTYDLKSLEIHSFKDVFVRAPFFKMITRPFNLTKNKIRIKLAKNNKKLNEELNDRLDKPEKD